MARGRGAALPSGRRTLERVRDEIERGWPPGLALLTGEELFHLDRAQRLLLDALRGEDPSGVGLTVWGEGRVDVERVVESARTSGMFTSRRVVFVRDAFALEGEPDALRAYAAAPPEGSFLIVRAPRLDTRKPLHKALVEAGRVFSFGPLAPEELLEATAELEKERGLRLEREARVFLVDACAADLCRISSELDKLRDFAGESSSVGTGLVREVVAGAGALSGWELSEAIEARDREAAFEAVRRLLGGEVSAEEPLRILGGLAYRARMLLRVRALVARGAKPLEAATRVRGFPDERLARAAMRAGLAEHLAVPARLLRADRALKGGSLPPLVVFERLVEELLGPAGGVERFGP